MEKGMIKLSILFPGGEDDLFDMDYYMTRHIPLVEKLLSKSLKRLTVEKGIAGGAPGSMAPYLAVAGLYFETMEAVRNSFEPCAGQIMEDLANFTDSRPLLQVSEVIM